MQRSPRTVVVIFAVPPVPHTGPASFRIPVSAVAIIPARYQSSRLPGKALADIAGLPMIQHVYRRAAAAASIARVIVATDDRRIMDVVLAFGGEAVMTSAAHQSGTDRLAEVAATLDCDVVVNVQGDEPVLAPETIDAAVEPFTTDPGLEMSTLRRRIVDAAEHANPNVTKVVVDGGGFAMYFSRAAIPFTRQGQPEAAAWAHVGLYVYRRTTLLRLAALPQTALERAEALEQLRALEHGIRIQAIETTHESIGVDTPEDLERVRALLAPAITR
jgi:3-deoxy-manno-octulosonate cytidylyltransferase (CMP-KDO synthetase)